MSLQSRYAGAVAADTACVTASARFVLEARRWCKVEGSVRAGLAEGMTVTLIVRTNPNPKL